MTAWGGLSLLEGALLGFFCSVRAPGDAVLKTYDLARALRSRSVTLVGGFQSPMEKEFLDLLLRGAAGAVVCPARGLGLMRLPRAWREPLDDGRLLVLSFFDEAAMACAGSEPVDDDEGGRRARAEAAHDALRDGPRPVLVRVADAAAQVSFVVDEVRHLTRDDGVGGGDIGVFAPDRNRIQPALKGLREAGLRCQSLSQFDGVPNDAVKVDTFHRAKGLEFKVVFLLGAAAFPRPRGSRQTDAEYVEQRAMQVSQLFVAMTRARDRLFVLCKDRPSDVLAGALAHFEERDERR